MAQTSGIWGAMRAARALGCPIVWLVYLHLSTASAENIERLIINISEVGDGSVTQARVEAERQAVNGGLGYRSTRKEDNHVFSGVYTPPELPADKKGRFVYGLALFADDGCNVSIGRTAIHSSLGRPQHLPDLAASFHVLQVAVAPGEPVEITVNYSNVIYNDNPKIPPYPDIDGCTLFLYLIPAGMAVDANRDGAIAFSGEARDTTSETMPFRFWSNDDWDDDTGDIVPPTVPDCEDQAIIGRRDLEDMTRLHVFFGGVLQEAVASGQLLVGFKWKRVTGSPSINIFEAVESDGGTRYLTDEATAIQQAPRVRLRNTLPDINGNRRRIAGTTPFILNQNFWTGLSGSNTTKYLLFEGCTEGKGQLIITFHKPGGAEISEGPSVWLDLRNIRTMYERALATPEDGFDPPYSSRTEPPEPNVSFDVYREDGNAFDPPAGEDKKAVVFIHGWNMTWDEYHSFSETMFKRLWHRGYKGRFCAFRWPTLTLTSLLSYNRSEHRAWKYGAALKDYVDTRLPRDYTVNLAAHSMGNVVAGAALHLGLFINNYALMQAAIPAGCFDARAIVNSYLPFLDAESNDPTPDRADPDLGYRGHLTGVNGNLINFYNLNDFALATGSYGGFHVNWEVNQEVNKPSSVGGRYYDYDPARVFPERYQLWQRLERLNVLVRYVTKHEEIMSFIARPRSRALGSRANVRGAIDGQVNVGAGSPSNFGDSRADHSAQFNRRIQELQPFYRELMQQLGTNPGQ